MHIIYKNIVTLYYKIEIKKYLMERLSELECYTKKYSHFKK